MTRSEALEATMHVNQLEEGRIVMVERGRAHRFVVYTHLRVWCGRVWVEVGSREAVERRSSWACGGERKTYCRD